MLSCNEKNELTCYIKARLTEFVKNKDNYSYETFGKVIETEISGILESYLIDKFKYKKDDFRTAKTKNDFPDFTIIKTNQAVEYKTASITEHPDNDMGTLNSWPEKIKSFGDEIYCIFTKYHENNGRITIENVYFDKMYKFIGLIEDGHLKYREKDGNLRPKSWNDFDKDIGCKSQIEFVKRLQETEKYRSYRIIKKHWDLISPKQQERFLSEIKSKK